jgi:hypothetical protein
MTHEVAMVNVTLGIAIMEDGQELPITNVFDDDGDDCDIADAVACVAGPDRAGKWVSIDLKQFERMAIQ